MGFNTDCGGVALTADIKVSNKATTWNTRLSQIGRTDVEIIIVSFSLGDMDYIEKILSKRPNGRNITLICSTNYYRNAQILKKHLPEMRVFVHPKAHAKLVLYAPETVWISSENIGHKVKSFDATVGIKDRRVYDHYHSQVESLLRSRDTIEIKEDESYA